VKTAGLEDSKRSTPTKLAATQLKVAEIKNDKWIQLLRATEIVALRPIGRDV
jgi:hypothetical protein